MVLSSFLITSRETLEAVLVVGIVFAYLSRTNNYQYKKTVYYGIFFGILLSILTAAIFAFFAGSFEGATEKIFEGFTMLFASVLLTTMILWMLKQKNIAKDIQNKVSAHIQVAGYNKTYAYGLFLLVFIAIFREGVETVIFLQALNYASGISFIGGLLGIIVAIAIGYLFFMGSKKINLEKFFTITSILLILFAAGLVAHGIHELQEATLIPYVVEEVWDINPAVVAAGTYPLLHENGLIGSFFKGLFGYNGNPSLLEVILYIAYLGIIILVYRKISTKSAVKN